MTHSQLLVDIANPFSDGMVMNPWQFDVARTPDIESIHAPAFGMCMRLLMRDVRANGQSALLIAGPAGSGKTHLVARILRRLRTNEPPGLLCYVNLDDVAPQMLWAHLRQRVGTDLLIHPDINGRTALERLLEIHLPGLLASGTPRAPDENLLGWISRAFAGKRRAQICTRLRQELFEKVRLDAEVRTALLKLFGDDAPLAQLARDWFLGERLTDEQLSRLGLPQGDLPDQVREHQSRQVVLSLLGLAGDSLPIVLCFDQIEGLNHTPQDQSGFTRLGQMIAQIRHGSGRGLFLITFCRSDKTHLLSDAVGRANWDRLAENHTNLSPLTWNEAVQLVLQRMNAVPALRELRRGQPDEYWPLGKQRLQAIHNRLRLTCTPRELLWECKKAFGTDEPTLPPEDYLLTKWRQKCQQKKALPAGERLLHALNGVPWLASLLGAAYQKVDCSDLQDAISYANLFVQAAGGERVAFSACPYSAHVWMRFRGLAGEWQKRSPRLNCKRLVLVCDVPSDQMKEGTRARLQTLTALPGVQCVCPPAERMVALDALHALLTDAHKGELVYEGQALPAEEVHRWAREGVTAAAHELGVLRLLFDELGLDLPAGAAAAADRPVEVARR